MWPDGKSGLDSGLDWTGFLGGSFFFRVGGVVLFFLVCKNITFSTFPQQAIFFPFPFEGEGGWERGLVLYRLYSSLLFVGFVLCVSFLV